MVLFKVQKKESKSHSVANTNKRKPMPLSECATYDSKIEIYQKLTG